LRRRLAAFVYEGVLLFGVVMVPGLIYAVLTRQTHALTGTRGLQWSVFLVVGAYFVLCWSRTGQTLAMQTWRVRLVDQAGGRVSVQRATMRYLLAWMWFAPALLTLHFTGLRGSGVTVFAALLAGVLGYAALAWLLPDRQYWHDAVCRTRLVNWQPPPRQS
jgi:uncharacterized RDD family membrane protein YckC